MRQDKETLESGGAILAFSIVTAVFLLTFALNRLILQGLTTGGSLGVFGIIASIVLTATTIAVKDLLDSAKK